jgi:hypothetical protein
MRETECIGVPYPLGPLEIAGHESSHPDERHEDGGKPQREIQENADSKVTRHVRAIAADCVASIGALCLAAAGACQQSVWTRALRFLVRVLSGRPRLVSRPTNDPVLDGAERATEGNRSAVSLVGHFEYLLGIPA